MSKNRLVVFFAICSILLLTVLPFVACCRTPVDTTIHELVMGSTSEPTTDNPFKMGIGAGDAQHQNFMYEPLIRVMFTEGPQPGLAESWTLNETTNIWTLKIYPDATFSDGTKVTAADAEWSLEKSMELFLGQTASLASALKQSAGATAKTETLELKDNGATGDTIVRTSGSFITDGWKVGEYVKVTGTADGPDAGTTGDNDATYRIKAVTATTITLYDYNTLINEGPKTGITLATGGPIPDAIKVVDEETLTLQMESFIATFIRYMGNTAIVPKALWEGMTNTEILAYANPDPVGSGPYILREREATSHQIYDANPDYWGGAPKIDVLKMLYFANSESELLALKAGTIDATSHFGMPSAVPQLLADPNIRVFQISSNTTITLYVNHRFAPWNLPAFRKAVSMAINRQDIVNYAANSWGNIPVMVERDPSFDDVVAVYDDLKWPGELLTQAERLTAANAMLDAIPGMSAKPATPPAGWTRTYNATPLIFSLESASDFSAQTTAAEQVVADLEDIGIDMNLTPILSSALVGKTFRQKSDATMSGWQTYVWGRAFTSDYDYFANQWQKYDVSNATRLTKRSYIYGWTGAAFDAVSAKLVQIQALPEGNATRNTLIGESMAGWANELPAIPLYSSIAPAVYRTDRYKGWVEGNGYLFYGSIQSMADVRNIMNLEPA
jgi:peptide/nickel transport system substrate-binding protein